MPVIRRYRNEDWPDVWGFLQPAIRAGDTYAYAPDSNEAGIQANWVDVPLATYVACSDDGSIVGTYTLKANQPGLGSHVCSCAYVTAAQARGRGIGTAMCEHSQAEARAFGFRSMQFNLVVATNTGAVRLWQKLGFHVVGRLPRAYRHQELGYVDALVMFKELVP
jgi:ribosomal protein S18 acetylase RimI-like enzyme